MNRRSILVLGFFVLSFICSASGEVIFWNDFQEVEVQILGDGEVIEEYSSDDNGGWDADMVDTAYYSAYAYSKSQLDTTYELDRLTADGRMFLEAYACVDYNEISARGRVYYQSVIEVVDEPAWLKISGYFTPSREHVADDHFLIGSPIWYWWTNGAFDEKVWMFDTALFDVGTHLIYGGVDYTVTAEPDSDGNVLYADYYFSVEVVDEPEFEPWDADLNGDGIVDMRDFALFASAWLYGAEE